MKFQVSHGISGDAALRRSPSKYHSLIAPILSGAESVTLIQFKSAVTLSREVDKALKKLTDRDTLIVAIARCFTIEARQLLSSVDAHIFTLSDFVWSDESYNSVRTEIGRRLR